MKKLLSLTLAILLLVGTFAFTIPASAEDANGLDTVYLKENGGNDENDGKTAETAVNTQAKAVSLLGNDGGTIVVVDTWTASEWNILPGAVSSASYTIKGADKATSKFIHSKQNIALNAPLTFTNIQYEAKNSWGGVFAQGKRLEFASDVTMTGSNAPYILGGGSAAVATSEIILNSGTFKLVYGGGNGVLVTDTIRITIGGTAKINNTNSVYAGAYNSTAAETADVIVNVTGGTFSYLYCHPEKATHTGDMMLTVSGGTFRKISGYSTDNGFGGKNFTVDMRNLNGVTAENYRNYVTNFPNKNTAEESVNKIVKLPDSASRVTAVKAQETAVDGGKYNVRFVSTVNGLSYDKAGYEVTATGTGIDKAWDYSTTTVYSSLLANGATVYPELAETYFSTMAVRGVTTDKVTFTVEAYVEVGAFRYYAEAVEFVYQNGECLNAAQ